MGPAQVCNLYRHAKQEAFTIIIKNRRWNMPVIKWQSKENTFKLSTNMGYWPPYRYLIFYNKGKVGKNSKTILQTTNSRVITYKVLYKLGNFYIAVKMQAYIFSTRCQTTHHFVLIEMIFCKLYWKSVSPMEKTLLHPFRTEKRAYLSQYRCFFCYL